MKHKLLMIVCLFALSSIVAHEKRLQLPIPCNIVRKGRLFGHLSTHALTNVPSAQENIHKNNEGLLERIAIQQKLGIKKKKITYTLALHY